MIKITEKKSLLRKLKGYNIEVDTGEGFEIIKRFENSGWTPIDKKETFSPITSFWLCKLQKDDEEIIFESDNWFCSFFISTEAYREYKELITKNNL